MGMRNFHLPLPDATYGQLRKLAEESDVPATTLARHAIDQWLREQARAARHAEIAAYADQMAGTEFDLDADLESASLDSLLK